MIMAWHGGGVFLIPIYPAKYLEQEREHYGGKVFTSANGCKVLWISARMLQNVVDQCKNVAKCCWSVLTSAKLKWGSWSRSLAGPWLAKHYLPYKICIFFVFNFFTLLIHRQFVFSSTNSSGLPEVHFDVVVSFWLLYDRSQKTKTKSQKWKGKVDLIETPKIHCSRVVGPGVTSVGRNLTP